MHNIVSLDFIKLPIPAKIVLYRYVILKISKNKSFHTHETTLSSLILFTDVLEMAYLCSLNGSTAEQEVLYLREKVADELFLTMANHVNNIANGNESIIFSSGFHSAKDHEYDVSSMVTTL